MKKVIITRGLPGSGKTTWAKEFLTQHHDYKRVNRDDLRLMLDNEQFNSDREEFISKIENNFILGALQEGYNVIVDATNLSQKRLDHLYQLVSNKALIEIKDFTYVPLEVCTTNDLKRPLSVGEKVIRRMYNDYLHPPIPIIQYNPNLPDAIICDIDGTLAIKGNRGIYEFEKAGGDKINIAVGDLTSRIRSDYFNPQRDFANIILSGREEKYREVTLNWLADNFIEYDDLFMRQTGDIRKDSVVKQEIYEREIKDKYNVLFVLDDRNQVVEMWRSLGLTCLQVAEGDF